MPRPFSIACLAALLIAGATVPATAAPKSDLDQFLITDKEAILLVPPEVVASWDARNAEWSPSGRFVLASRTFLKLPPIPMGPPDFRRSMVLWDADERKNTEIWKGSPQVDSDPQFGWLASGDIAFAVVRVLSPLVIGQPPAPPRAWLLRIDARRPALRTVSEVSADATLHTSSRDPLAVLVDGSQRVLRVLRADGTVGRTVPYPADVQLHSPAWSPDRSRLVFASFIPEVKAKPGVESRYAFDPRSGELVPYSGSATAPTAPDPSQLSATFQLKRTESQVQQGSVRRPITPLWLEAVGAPEARVLVSADAEWGKLSPRGDAVMYRAGGAVWVAPLARLSRAEFLRARGAAFQQVAISNAKQLALGVIIWASKNGDTLPSSDQPVWDLIQPIVKSESLGDGFVYIYGGGKLTEVAKPAETVLGYVLGPGGRAEIFVDGHVVWKDD